MIDFALTIKAPMPLALDQRLARAPVATTETCPRFLVVAAGRVNFAAIPDPLSAATISQSRGQPGDHDCLRRCRTAHIWRTGLGRYGWTGQGPGRWHGEDSLEDRRWGSLQRVVVDLRAPIGEGSRSVVVPERRSRRWGTGIAERSAEGGGRLRPEPMLPVRGTASLGSQAMTSLRDCS